MSTKDLVHISLRLPGCAHPFANFLLGHTHPSIHSAPRNPLVVIVRAPAINNDRSAGAPNNGVFQTSSSLLISFTNIER